MVNRNTGSGYKDSVNIELGEFINHSMPRKGLRAVVEEPTQSDNIQRGIFCRLAEDGKAVCDDGNILFEGQAFQDVGGGGTRIQKNDGVVLYQRGGQRPNGLFLLEVHRLPLGVGCGRKFLLHRDAAVYFFEAALPIKMAISRRVVLVEM